MLVSRILGYHNLCSPVYKHTQSNGSVLFVDRRFLINGFLRFILSVFRGLCCGVQMTTATTYTETSQLSLFDFFDTFSCECGAAHLAYLNLREQWIKVIAPLEHCSISYRAVIAETCPHHSNAITKPRVGLSKPQFHIWPTGHRQWFWGCLEIKCIMCIIQFILLLIYLYISFILSIMRHNQGMIYIWLAITIDFEIELG